MLFTYSLTEFILIIIIVKDSTVYKPQRSTDDLPTIFILPKNFDLLSFTLEDSTDLHN